MHVYIYACICNIHTVSALGSLASCYRVLTCSRYNDTTRNNLAAVVIIKTNCIELCHQCIGHRAAFLGVQESSVQLEPPFINMKSACTAYECIRRWVRPKARETASCQVQMACCFIIVMLYFRYIWLVTGGKTSERKWCLKKTCLRFVLMDFVLVSVLCLGIYLCIPRYGMHTEVYGLRIHLCINGW